MQGVLVFSERDALAHELISGAKGLGCESVSVCLVGAEASARAADCFAYGAAKAVVAEGADASGLDAEALAGLLAAVAEQAGR